MDQALSFSVTKLAWVVYDSEIVSRDVFYGAAGKCGGHVSVSFGCEVKVLLGGVGSLGSVTYADANSCFLAPFGGWN